jgi:site-specific recombinase XerD
MLEELQRRNYAETTTRNGSLSPSSVTPHLAVLRFFYAKTLKKAWSIAETPYPKRAFHLPSILIQEELTRLIDAALPYHRILLMTLYAKHLLNENTYLAPSEYR